jgi:hypothetical protein
MSATPQNTRPIFIPVSPQTQLNAAVAILDRGYGRPGLAVELTGNEEATNLHGGESAYDIICRRLDAIRQRLIEDGHPVLMEP